MLQRLRIELSAKHPIAKITDLETGEQLKNVYMASLTINPNGRPMVNLQIGVDELEVLTDGTLKVVRTVKTYVNSRE